MKRSSASSELPDLRSPERGISHAKAHLLAEGSHWLATGQTVHVESEPMGRVLARMDEVVPLAEHYQWLMTPLDELGGHRPMDFVDADEVEPLEDFLDQLAGNGSGHGSA